MRDKYNKANNSLTMIVIMRVIVPRVVGTSDGNLNQVVILKVMDGHRSDKRTLVGRRRYLYTGPRGTEVA